MENDVAPTYISEWHLDLAIEIATLCRRTKKLYTRAELEERFDQSGADIYIALKFLHQEGITDNNGNPFTWTKWEDDRKPRWGYIKKFEEMLPKLRFDGIHTRTRASHALQCIAHLTETNAEVAQTISKINRSHAVKTRKDWVATRDAAAKVVEGFDDFLNGAIVR